MGQASGRAVSRSSSRSFHKTCLDLTDQQILLHMIFWMHETVHWNQFWTLWPPPLPGLAVWWLVQRRQELRRSGTRLVFQYNQAKDDWGDANAAKKKYQRLLNYLLNAFVNSLLTDSVDCTESFHPVESRWNCNLAKILLVISLLASWTHRRCVPLQFFWCWSLVFMVREGVGV